MQTNLTPFQSNINTLKDAIEAKDFKKTHELFIQTAFQPAAAIQRFVEVAPTHDSVMLIADYRHFTRNNLTKDSVFERASRFCVILEACSRLSILTFFEEEQSLLAKIKELGGNVPDMVTIKLRSLREIIKRNASEADMESSGFILLGHDDLSLTWFNRDINLSFVTRAPKGSMRKPQGQISEKTNTSIAQRFMSPAFIAYAADEMEKMTGKRPNLTPAITFTKKAPESPEEEFRGMTHQARLDAGFTCKEEESRWIYTGILAGKKASITMYKQMGPKKKQGPMPGSPSRMPYVKGPSNGGGKQKEAKK